MKIYTKTGDDGTTGLIGGARINKNSALIAAVGDIDELNAAIGLARAGGADDALLKDVQEWLFDLGAEVASPNPHSRQHRALGAKQIEALEQSMDAQTENLPPLTKFILPGGSEAAARLHVARCVCRRAERSVLELEGVSGEARVFLNRLSDWLFVAARTANASKGVPDVVWDPTGD